MKNTSNQTPPKNTSNEKKLRVRAGIKAGLGGEDLWGTKLSGDDLWGVRLRRG